MRHVQTVKPWIQYHKELRVSTSCCVVLYCVLRAHQWSNHPSRESYHKFLRIHTFKLIHHHHHHISIMELGHLLTRSDLTYPEVSSKVCRDSFCQLENSVSLPWVIYYEAFYLHVVFSFSCTPVMCPKLVLFLIPL